MQRGAQDDGGAQGPASRHGSHAALRGYADPLRWSSHSHRYGHQSSGASAQSYTAARMLSGLAQYGGVLSALEIAYSLHPRPLSSPHDAKRIWVERETVTVRRYLLPSRPLAHVLADSRGRRG